MATVTFTTQLQTFTNGEPTTSIAATRYRDAVTELCNKYSDLSADIISEFAVGIDDVVFQNPLLEVFDEHSRLIFLPKIAAG